MTRQMLDTLIGCRLAVGFPGTEATKEVIDALQATQAQNLILFSRNFRSSEQLRRLVRQLDEALQRQFLVMVDHEGGRVVRFRSGLTPFPAAATMGRTAGPTLVERQGATEASELKRLGISINLAPCVDVLMPGGDPIIGDRAYGSDAALVGACAQARIRGLQSHGVAACAKHFPGLGAVPRDPHKVLPTIRLDWPTMESVHLAPFRAAMACGVAAIMSSHVCYPGLGDPAGVPATFSSRLIHDLLRTRLGFRGLILTDDLEMGALRAWGSMGEVAIRATEAGHDLLLICSDLDLAEEAFSSLRQAYRNGRLSTAALEASAARVVTLRQQFL